MLHRFRCLIRRAEPKPKAPAPGFSFLYGVPDWTTQDMAYWRTFLETPTGKTLKYRAQAVLFNNALQGCRDSVTTTHSAARAAGFAEAWEWLESLSRSASDRAENDAERPEGEPSFRELLSP